MPSFTRRSLLKHSATGLAGISVAAPAFSATRRRPNETFVVACMGVRGRGRKLLYDFAELPEVKVKTICDVDTRLFDERQEKAPQLETDFRRLLDDKSIHTSSRGHCPRCETQARPAAAMKATGGTFEASVSAARQLPNPYPV